MHWKKEKNRLLPRKYFGRRPLGNGTNANDKKKLGGKKTEAEKRQVDGQQKPKKVGYERKKKRNVGDQTTRKKPCKKPREKKDAQNNRQKKKTQRNQRVQNEKKKTNLKHASNPERKSHKKRGK